MTLKIEYVNKQDLKPYANNAKLHDAEQVEQIKESIREFGFNDPVAVWHDNEIIEGHGRLLAVMEMDDINAVPVIRLDELSDEQRRAYMLVHNKLTMNTDFDVDLLNVELDDIIDIDMQEFGFTNLDMDFIDFEEAEKIDSSKRMNSSIVTVVLGAAKFEIEDKTHSIYDATRNINQEKATEFLTDAILRGLMS